MKVVVVWTGPVEPETVEPTEYDSADALLADLNYHGAPGFIARRSTGTVAWFNKQHIALVYPVEEVKP